MSRSVDVSVVVSTFQRRNALRNAIESLLNQQVPPDLSYEIIIVDNNSSDGTAEMVREYVARAPELIRYAVEPRQGVSHGRNTGIAAAHGDIIAFTDDDNVVGRGWVAKIHRILGERADVAGVGGRVLPDWPASPPEWLDRRHWSPLAILDYGDVAFATSAKRPLCLLTANLALRRSALERIDGFSPDFPRCQDHELLIRLWRAGERILYSPELVVYAPLDRERLSREYHRRWHARHGRYAAGMQLEEAIDATGTLRATVPDTARVWGAAGHVYAGFPRHAAGYAAAKLRREPALAAHHEYRLRYLAAYIGQRRRLTSDERRPTVLELAGFVREHVARRARGVRMSAGRIVTVHVLLALLLGGSAYDIVTGREHWPVSPYPMFSSVEREPVLRQLVLRGVTDEPTPREIAMRDPSFIGPFDQCRIVTAMSRARTSDAARLHAMLRDTLDRYDAMRSSGASDGPKLQAVRLYDALWTLQPDAANREQPDSARLLDEVRAGN